MIRFTSNIRCRGCGYALRGLGTQRCPECGRAFDLTNSDTYASEILDGRQLLFWALCAAGLFVFPVLWTAMISLFNAMFTGVHRTAGTALVLVSLFIWLIFPAFGALMAKDMLAGVNKFKKEGRGLVENENMARAGHWLLRAVVMGMTLMMALLIVFAGITAFSSLF